MKKAFTLIELLVVVLIIGILSAVALPQYRVAVEKARLAKNIPLIRTILRVQKVFYQNQGVYTCDDDNLEISIPYKKKIEREGEICMNGIGNRYAYKLPDGNYLYLTGGAIYYGGRGYNVDFYNDNTGICYAATNSFGERVCKSFGGEKREYCSSGNTCYRTNF